MTEGRPIVLQTRRHLKWRALDPLEYVLMSLCGVAIVGFTTSVFLDVVTRTIGAPWLWLQEVTSTFFTYGAFIGAAVATRRHDHLNLSAITDALDGPTRTVLETVKGLIVLAVGVWLVGFGYANFLNGFGSYRMPSLTPIASLYAAIPISGALIALFAIELLVNGWRNGFADRDGAAGDPLLQEEDLGI
ncbi:MAG TPA: TRAP transporter small permease subunit [Candidatus Sulfotelmatobacter sp.]|nr:TRAP transporter small permease subunit [Candidatus Sulfotelmatobacter sp.]